MKTIKCEFCKTVNKIIGDCRFLECAKCGKDVCIKCGSINIKYLTYEDVDEYYHYGFRSCFRVCNSCDNGFCDLCN